MAFTWDCVAGRWPPLRWPFWAPGLCPLTLPLPFCEFGGWESPFDSWAWPLALPPLSSSASDVRTNAKSCRMRSLSFAGSPTSDESSSSSRLTVAPREPLLASPILRHSPTLIFIMECFSVFVRRKHHPRPSDQRWCFLRVTLLVGDFLQVP